MRSIAFGVCLVVAAVAVGACSSGKSKHAARGEKFQNVEPTVTTATTTPVDPAQADADHKQAESVVFQTGDFPKGWTTSPHAADPNEHQATREVSVCLGVPDPFTLITANVDGPDAKSPDGKQVFNNAQVFRSDHDVRNDMAAVRGPKFADCQRETLLKAYDAQSRAAKVTPETLQAPPYGDLSGWVRLTAEPTQPGLQTQYVDLIVLAKGRVELSLTFVSAGSPFDADLERQLLDKVGGRLANV